MDVDQKKIGRAVQMFRKARGLTQRELAKETGLTVNFLSLLENGRRGISLEKLNEVANTLNVPTAFIVFLGTTHRNSDPSVRKVVKEIKKLVNSVVAAESQLASSD